MKRILPLLLALCLLLQILPLGALATGETTETTVETTEATEATEETTEATEETTEVTQPENEGHVHCSCTQDLFGGSQDCIAADHSESREWYAWSDANALPQYNSAANDKDGNPVSGSPRFYYLTTDVTVSGAYKTQGKTYICLNGHSITVTGGMEIATELTLVDCQAKFDSQGYLSSQNGITAQIVVNKPDAGTSLRMYGVKLHNVTGGALKVTASPPSMPSTPPLSAIPPPVRPTRLPCGCTVLR